LQSEEPKIHLLYSKCIDLIKAILVRFISVKYFTDEKGSKLLEKNELLKVIADKSHHKVLTLFLCLFPFAIHSLLANL